MLKLIALMVSGKISRRLLYKAEGNYEKVQILMTNFSSPSHIMKKPGIIITYGVCENQEVLHYI